jgi:tetratricopeptide (TPR) repeat protein
VGHWLNNLPGELGYGLATSFVLAVAGWALTRARRRRAGPAARETAPPAAIVVPRRLPRAPQRFVNREAQLTSLDGLLDRAETAEGPVVAVLSGMRGVGKSAMGSIWAHRNRGRFPGGTLCADFSRRGNPHGVRVSDVLGDFLRELGTSDAAMPITLRDRQRLFEHLTAERKLLVVLDDVDQPAQAISALPAGPGSLVVVTSAFGLEELVRGGAHPVFVDPLDDVSARALLVEIVEDGRFDDDPAATLEVVTACGGLPIALCVCGARIATRPERDVAWLAERLRAGPGRLATLSPHGEFNVAAVFSMAYRDLGLPAAMLYRRLGLHPGPDFTAPAAAALVGLPLTETTALLDQLEDAYLLSDDGDGHLRPHDLVRDHMRVCAIEDDDEADRDLAVGGAVGWYTAAVRAADHAVVEDRLRLGEQTGLTASDLPRLRSPADAFTWFGREARNVLAAQHAALDRELHERVWQIAEALWPLCASHKRFTEWIESHDAAILAGERLGDQRVLARMRSQLARAYAELGDYQRAGHEMALALEAALASGDEPLLASVIEFGGVCQLRAGDLANALQSFGQARAGFESCGLERGVALQDYHVGWCLILCGDYELALEPLDRAKATMERLGDSINVGRCLVRQGEVLARLNRVERARVALGDAIDVLDGCGVGFEQAEAHEALAALAERERDADVARAHRQRAYRLYRELGHPRADALLAILDNTTT